MAQHTHMTDSCAGALNDPRPPRARAGETVTPDAGRGRGESRDRQSERTKRTEDWPAAVYPVGRSLATGNGERAPTEHNVGPDGAISEHVRQEVLSPLWREARAVLRGCSALDELAARLCDELLDRSDSKALLETLAIHDRTPVPVDASEEWRRCHSLVGEVLRAELSTRDPDSASCLSRSASRWFEEQGDTVRAIEHAIGGSDAERAGELLWAHSEEFFVRGRGALVSRWLDEFPAHAIAGSPALSLCAALANLLGHGLPAAEHWARSASRAVASQPAPARRQIEGGCALVTAAIARDGIDQMRTVAAEAGALLGETSPWTSFCWLLRGVADHVSGDRREARAALEMGMRPVCGQMPMVEALCSAQLAMIDAEEGAWERAAERAEIALVVASAPALADEPYATLVFALSAWIAGQQGHCDDAKRDLTVATRMLARYEGLLPWYEVETRLLVARASVKLADVVSARTSLSRASRVVRRLADAPGFRTWLEDGWSELDDHSASRLSGAAALTLAELRILRFLPTHLAFWEIGQRLHVSKNTVKTQAHAVYGKLGVASRSEAVAEASALGLIHATIV